MQSARSGKPKGEAFHDTHCHCHCSGACIRRHAVSRTCVRSAGSVFVASYGADGNPCSSPRRAESFQHALMTWRRRRRDRRARSGWLRRDYHHQGDQHPQGPTALPASQWPSGANGIAINGGDDNVTLNGLADSRAGVSATTALSSTRRAASLSPTAWRKISSMLALGHDGLRHPDAAVLRDDELRHHEHDRFEQWLCWHLLSAAKRLGHHDRGDRPCRGHQQFLWDWDQYCVRWRIDDSRHNKQQRQQQRRAPE